MKKRVNVNKNYKILKEYKTNTVYLMNKINK